jgi:CRP-like cAMP-binding protein
MRSTIAHSDRHEPPRNRLLTSLPRADLLRLMKSLERVDLPLGQRLHEPGQRHEHFYFPETCIVSLLGVLANGDSTEVSLTGREGGIGLGLILGGGTTLVRATVQSAGLALRWKTTAMRRELKRRGAVQRMLLRYVQAVWTQTAQSVLCNRHHTITQQLCRWFLMSLDRVDGSELRMTQKLIANMLGVRRERVALTAKKMRMKGWISYQHGRVIVIDRRALEVNVCECYEVVKAEYRRLLVDQTQT